MAKYLIKNNSRRETRERSDLPLHSRVLALPELWIGTKEQCMRSMNCCRDYLELCKIRVVALMTLTAIVAMFLAAPPGELSWKILVLGALGITLAACSGGVVNHLIDRHIDAIMARTKARPVASGRVQPWQAWIWAGFLLASGMAILILWVNPLSALLSFLAMVGYAGIYTLFLKRATPQNIVIGGLQALCRHY